MTSQVRAFEWKTGYVRFLPNPGFQFILFGREVYWSRHRGWKIERVRSQDTKVG